MGWNTRCEQFWRGRSGTIYRLFHEPVESFVLSGSDLYVLTVEDRIIWAGALSDVLHDTTSRTRFRRALRIADGAFRHPAPRDGLERMGLVWDLEGALPHCVKNAA
jgi:hypothetical protein